MLKYLFSLHFEMFDNFFINAQHRPEHKGFTSYSTHIQDLECTEYVLYHLLVPRPLFLAK